MKHLNPNQYLDMTFMFLLHEMTKVFELFQKIKNKNFDAYLREYALIKFRFSLQVPCLVVSPQNQHSTKTTEFVRWKEAWVYHFNTEGLNLLDTDFKIVICYNGIHHFTSTKILSTDDQNKAIIKLLSIMGTNMNQLAGNLQGCENVKNFIHHTHQQLTSLEQDPSTKLTPPTSSAGPLLLLLRPLLLLLLQINIDTIVTNVTKSSRDPMNCRHMSLLNMVKVSLVNSVTTNHFPAMQP